MRLVPWNLKNCLAHHRPTNPARFSFSLRSRARFVAFVLGILFTLLPLAHAKNILIQGATLIDGTGKAPMPDSRILIEGNTIRKIWSGDAVEPLPPGTQVLDAKGKFIRLSRFRAKVRVCAFWERALSSTRSFYSVAIPSKQNGSVPRSCPPS